jgi:hypothetical protein
MYCGSQLFDRISRPIRSDAGSSGEPVRVRFAVFGLLGGRGARPGGLAVG